jgi:type IV pilus assembly protein PilW
MKSQTHRLTKGFTVVELMVAMTIGMLVSLMVVTVFAGSATTYRVANSNAELLEAGRVALETIGRDVRIAGFRGCNSNNVANSGPLTNRISGPTGYNNDLANFARVYNANGGIYDPVTPFAYVGIDTNSDILLLRIPSGPVHSLNGLMANATAAIPLAATNDLAVGTRAVIADCALSVAFRVTGIAGTTLQHDATFNTATDVVRAFGQDAVVIPYTTRAYFIGDSSSGVAGERSLYVQNGGGTPEELVENVDEMQVYVGLDANNDWVADQFVEVTAATNMQQAVAVQVHLLTRGNRDNETGAITPYFFDGQTITPTDRFIRRVYVSTMQLRNRAL